MKFIFKSFLFKFFLNLLALLYFIFDEVFLLFSSLLDGFIQKFRFFEIFNSWLVSLNKYYILSILLLLLGISELLGLFSFMLLADGRLFLFIFFYIVKFFPFFIVSYVFNHTKDSLLTISWFNYSYTKISIFISYLKSTSVFIQIKLFKDSFLSKKSSLQKKFNFLVNSHRKNIKS